MPSKTANAKKYLTTTIKGVEYFRTGITDTDGKRVTLYARASEELDQKVQDAKQEIVEAKFFKENPTVAEEAPESRREVAIETTASAAAGM